MIVIFVKMVANVITKIKVCNIQSGFSLIMCYIQSLISGSGEEDFFFRQCIFAITKLSPLGNAL